MALDLALEAGPLTRQTGWLARYQPGLRFTGRGYVLSVGDGIAWIHGLPSAAQQVHLSKVLQIQAERLLAVRDKVLARIQALQPVTVEALKTRYHGVLLHWLQIESCWRPRRTHDLAAVTLKRAAHDDGGPRWFQRV